MEAAFRNHGDTTDQVRCLIASSEESSAAGVAVSSLEGGYEFMGFGASTQVYLGRDENSYKCSSALASSLRLTTPSSWSLVSGNTAPQHPPAQFSRRKALMLMKLGLPAVDVTVSFNQEGWTSRMARL